MAAVNKGRNHSRDASFSSYLDSADTDCVRSLAASMHESSPIFTPSRQTSSSSPSFSMSKRLTRGPLGEISVFAAESYFGAKMDRHDSTSTCRSVEDRVLEIKREPKLRPPSIRSESSQSSRSNRSTDQVKPKKSIGGPWFFAGLQCIGSCYDVEPPLYIMKQSSTTSTNQRKGFWEDQAFQINSKKFSTFAFPKTQEEDPSGSIEVLGRNPKIQKEDQEEGDGGEMYDDMESDASSDLFDIPVFPAEMSPEIAPYEPSEASIEWSVVTASAAELSEEMQVGSKKKTTSLKPKHGGILGCKNDKAVKVVNPVNATARMASFPPKNSSLASDMAANTCPPSSARAPRAIHMH